MRFAIDLNVAAHIQRQLWNIIYTRSKNKMARKYPTDVLEQAQTILSAWNVVGATTNLGTLLPAAISADLTAAAATEAQIASLESQLTDARNKRDALYDGLWQKMVRVRMAAKVTFGDDSSQYELFGGTRRSDRKPRSRKAVAA
jgi:hypothetical protein